MATLHAAVKTYIEGLSAFTTLMSGGVYESDDIDFLEGGGWLWAQQVGLVVNQLLVPHAILRWKDSTPHQANFAVLGAELETLEAYLYAPLGSYSVLEAARVQLKLGLHDVLFEGLDDRTVALCRSVFASGEIPADEYQMNPSRFMRFTFTGQLM